MTLKKISTSSLLRRSPKYENLRVGYVSTTSTPTIEVLVVGGGGVAGYYNGSGGGAGGVLYSSSLADTSGVSCTVTIGAGGGGFLMFYAKDKERLESRFTKLGLEQVKFKFDFEGTKVIMS